MLVDVSCTYLRDDQPTTCPRCGARTWVYIEFTGSVNNSEVDICLDPICQHAFLIEDDKNFNRESAWYLLIEELGETTLLD